MRDRVLVCDDVCYSFTLGSVYCTYMYRYSIAVCVCVPGAGGEVEREIQLDLKHGVEAKNYDDVSGSVWCVCSCAAGATDTHTSCHISFPQLGKAEKLKPMELELRRLEDLAESIVNDFAYMRAREEEMRDTNGELLVSESSEVSPSAGNCSDKILPFLAVNTVNLQCATETGCCAVQHTSHSSLCCLFSCDLSLFFSCCRVHKL